MDFFPLLTPRAAARGARPLPLGDPWRATFAVEDGVMLAYVLAMGALVARADAGPIQRACAHRLELSLFLVLAGPIVARKLRAALPAWLRIGFYRLAIVGALLLNYLSLRELLPLVRPDSVDAALHRVDLWLFGVEPSLWLERFATRPAVEYFSFFYFSYFFLLTAFMIAVLWLPSSARARGELAIGTTLVYCIGQIGYVLVPGYGPIRHLADQFHAPIAGGPMWGLVWSTVQAGSAVKDIFPSLHTAGPTWFALLAFRMAERDPRWRWPARIAAFFAANIVVSTMFLRWHWGIDVVAGLALAFSVRFAVPRIAAWQARARARRGLVEAWAS